MSGGTFLPTREVVDVSSSCRKASPRAKPTSVSSSNESRLFSFSYYSSLLLSLLLSRTLSAPLCSPFPPRLFFCPRSACRFSRGDARAPRVLHVMERDKRRSNGRDARSRTFFFTFTRMTRTRKDREGASGSHPESGSRFEARLFRNGIDSKGKGRRSTPVDERKARYTRCDGTAMLDEDDDVVRYMGPTACCWN